MWCAQFYNCVRVQNITAVTVKCCSPDDGDGDSGGGGDDDDDDDDCANKCETHSIFRLMYINNVNAKLFAEWEKYI